MTVNSSFFNSSNGDRIYQAANFAAYFASFIGNGVFPNPSTNLQVLQDVDRIVKVAPGKGWINGYYVENTSDFNIQIPAADGSLNRIDRIFLGLNLTNRAISIYAKQGTPSPNPVAPTLTRTPLIYELALADVYVNRGAIRITQANILDQRMNGNLCGIVSGVVNQVDTTTLYNQYQEDFMEWSDQQRADFEDFLQGIENALDGNVAGNLQNQINMKADKNNPVFTGTVGIPTRPNGDNTVNAANTEFVSRAIRSNISSFQPNFQGAPVWLRVGSLTSGVESGSSRLTAIISGLGNVVLNNSDTVLINCSNRVNNRMEVRRLNDNPYIASTSARYGYRINAVSGVTEYYIMIPANSYNVTALRMGVSQGSFDFETVATSEPGGIVYVEVRDNIGIDYTGNKNNLLTTDKTNFVNSINELFTSVSNGKNSIAAAIASKGVPTPEGASFGVLEANIRDIDMGVRYARGEINISAVTGQFARVSPSAGTQNRNYITVSGLNFFPARIFIYDRLETYTVEFNGITRGSARSIIVSSSSGTPSFEIFSNSTLSAYVVNGGFRLPLSASAVQGSNVYWEAYAL